jgi:hypothetical protein
MLMKGDHTERATTKAMPPRALAPGGNASLHADLSSLSAAAAIFHPLAAPILIVTAGD